MGKVLDLNGLVMPSCYVSIDDEEMEYTDGGAWWVVVGWVAQVVSWGCWCGSSIAAYNGNAELALGLGIAAATTGLIGTALTGIKAGK